MSTTTLLSRFWLWVDGVGGYLVCPADDVVIGTPAGGATVDVPMLADLSRRHARIIRQGESYLFETHRPATVQGENCERKEALVGKSVLSARSTIDLDQGVRLRFVRPHPLSLSARLEFASAHRTQPYADAVVFLADTMVLGPDPRAHIVCPHWTDEVVVTRQDDQLFARASTGLMIDGVPHGRRGPLTLRSQVSGVGFAFSLDAR